MTKAWGRKPEGKQRWPKGVLERQENKQRPIPPLPGVSHGDRPRQRLQGVITFTVTQMVSGTHKYCGEFVFPERCFRRETCPINHICWSYRGMRRGS